MYQLTCVRGDGRHIVTLECDTQDNVFTLLREWLTRKGMYRATATRTARAASRTMSLTYRGYVWEIERT